MVSILKDHPVLKIVSGALVELPTPANISTLWNFGSLLGLCLATQLLTGLFLAMHFCADVSLAFSSVSHIARDVNCGWILRMLHANGASFFFICLYMHVGRGLYYGSYVFKFTWIVGVVILLAVMATAFLGYVLPWGQMSFWGATVITNLFSAIPYVGEDLVKWMWGGFAVDNPTLTRFFSLHFLLPFVVAALSMVHLLFLHQTGGGNPLGVSSNFDKISFHPYFSFKDLFGFFCLLSVLFLVCFTAPWAMGDPENFIPANPLVTPVHIQPEWYFLMAYAILRSIPNKLGGVVALALSILILIVCPFLPLPKFRGLVFYPLNKIYYWAHINIIFLLTWIGARPVEDPYIIVGQVLSCVYFCYYFVGVAMQMVWDKLIYSWSFMMLNCGFKDVASPWMIMTWGQFGLQDGNSPIMEELVFLHDFINLVLMFVISFVGFMMVSMMKNSFVNKNLLEMQMVESVWTLIPAVILIQIALPSLLLLYMLDESIDSTLTLKAIGHQWYWSYEYSDFWSTRLVAPLEFDSYMVSSGDSVDSSFRLLDADNHTVAPVKTHVRMLISSADVLHAWAVPSLGVKADAVPGRLNQVKFIGQRPGVFFGQCSEICGANHSFMPIVMEFVPGSVFINWVISIS